MKTKVTHGIISLIITAISIWAAITYMYTQKYVQDSTITATKGILFKKTLNLDKYVNVSSGNGFLGKYNRYSRSDRHSEVITVYCKEYCKD